MKTTIVTINDTTPTLVFKGPGRIRFRYLGPFAIGASDVTYDTGYSDGSYPAGEFPICPGEKVFAIGHPGSGPVQVLVLEYGTP